MSQKFYFRVLMYTYKCSETENSLHSVSLQIISQVFFPSYKECDYLRNIFYIVSKLYHGLETISDQTSFNDHDQYLGNVIMFTRCHLQKSFRAAYSWSLFRSFFLSDLIQNVILCCFDVLKCFDSCLVLQLNSLYLIYNRQILVLFNYFNNLL